MIAEIISHVQKTVTERKNDPEYRKQIEDMLQKPTIPLPFSLRDGANTIIAEIKPASPSEDQISADSVEDIANQYALAGASALSVLTEERFFKGSLDNIKKIKAIVNVPIMRKDFIVDKFQIDEALAYGADGILLMTSVLQDKISDFLQYAGSKGMWALVEVHTDNELEIAKNSGAKIIGVNNRDLKTLHVNLETCIKLSAEIPDHVVFVVESGISTPADIQLLKVECKRAPDAFLVGYALMKSVDRVSLLTEFVKA